MNSRYKAVKTIDRKYYKLLPWTQPVLSANGTIGGSSFAVLPSSQYDTTTYPAWQAFNGVTTASDTTGWRTPSLEVGSTHNIVIYNPTALEVTDIAYTNGGIQAVQAPVSGTVYGSNNNVTWTELTTYTNSVTTAGQTWHIDMSNNTNAYTYYKITFTNNSSAGYIWCAELELTADQIIEATEQDYDFYEEVEQYKVVKTIDRKYYKTSSWTQEKFSSESDNGVLGGDKFAISVPSYYTSYYGWYAYDGIDNYQHGWCSRTITVDVDGLTIYNPNPLKISTLEIHHFTGTVYVYRAYQGKLMGSNDGSSWTQLTSWSVADTTAAADVITLSLSLDTGYKYYKIVPIATHSNKYWGVQELYITANQVIEATEQDYDFYEDVDIYKAILD